MEVLALVTGLGAAFFYALSAVFIRRWGDSSSIIDVVYTSIFFNFLASFVLYIALSRSFDLWSFSALALSGVLAPGIARTLNYRSIPEIGASSTSTIANSAPIFSTGMAVLLLGEKFTVPRLAGNVVVVIGLLMLVHPFTLYTMRRAIPAFSAAFFYGTAYVLRRAGSLTLRDPFFGTLSTSLGSLTVMMLWRSLGLGEKGRLLTRPDRLSVLVGIITTAALLLQLSAFSLGDALVVAPAVSSSPIFAVVLASLILKDRERVGIRHATAALLVVLGLTLLNL